jgi:thiol-disulfide isomerase/thioredoxin
VSSSSTSTNLAAAQPPIEKQRGRMLLAIALITLGICMLAIALVLWVIGSTGSAQGVSKGRPRVGAAMEDFSLNDLQGIEVRLSDYQGQPVLINFWATWCPPCREEMPLFSEFYLANQDSGFVILAVDVGEEWDLVADFAYEQNLPFPVLLDPDQQFAGALRINAYPTSVLVGRDGKIKSVHVGMYTEKQLERDVLPYLDY